MKQNWEPEVKQGIAKLWTLAVGLVGEDRARELFVDVAKRRRGQRGPGRHRLENRLYDLPNHVQRALEAFPHTVECDREQGNLVLARLDTGLDVLLAEADRLGHRRHALDRRNHQVVQQQVHHYENDRKYYHKRNKARDVEAASELQRNRRWHGHDLRTDYLFKLPSESVCRSIGLRQGRRRRRWRAVAGQTSLIADCNWPRETERRPDWSVAFEH